MSRDRTREPQAKREGISLRALILGWLKDWATD